ncbi:MAG: 23S rRNA (guanine745-N1)-methyltransferase [Paraglaciecola sp.]|jgi:23S rRNA (guanine745-N1)-methyltransferase
MWICPACQSPLSLLDRTWQCDLGHVYDQAKEGYVNLVLAQQKHSKEPGDNKQMVTARRAFLEQNHYQPLAKLLAELIVEYQILSDIRLFDAGCGEGYYLDAIFQSFADKNISIHASGIDISKVAVQKAAKKYPANSFAVASSFKLPVLSHSQDVLIQVFAPGSALEVHRVLSEKGIWIQVSPGPQHLIELKHTVYDEPHEHKPPADVTDGFSLLSERSLTFGIELEDQQQRMDLLMMTPFYWSSRQDKIELMLASMEQVSADFTIRVWQKN